MSKNMGVICKLSEEVTSAKKNNISHFPFTIAFSNWINGFVQYEMEIFERKSFTEFGVQYNVRRGVEVRIMSKDGQSVLIKKKGYGDGRTKAEAYENCFEVLIKSFLAESNVQMDVKEEDLITLGKVTSSEVADREANVILEVDEQGDEAQVEVLKQSLNKDLISTERYFDMIGDGYSIMNRWYPLQQFNVTQGTTDIFSVRLPEALYNNQTSVNLLPLKGFLYGDLDLEVKIVLNAAPFQSGRLIFGLFYCAQGMITRGGFPSKMNFPSPETGEFVYGQLETKILGVNGMLQRPHVICDLAKSTSAVLPIKFMFNKSVVRLLDYNSNKNVNPGVLGANFVNLRGLVLSKIRTGDDQPKDLNGTVFYRFVKADLTGMTKAHSLTQMDTFSDLLNMGSNILNMIENPGSTIINAFEHQLLRKGKRVKNSDKPSMVFNNIVNIPRARLHQPNGVGVADSVIMGIDPRVLTTHYEMGVGPKSYLDLARIRGITKTFMWKVSAKKNEVLFNQTVSPCPDFHDGNPILNSEFKVLEVDDLPLHIACNGFMNWGGTIIYEFDVVKTEYHKGTLLISINFGKGKESGENSTYEKIVDLQETSNIRVTVPYIYDTVCRRLPNTPFFRTVNDIQAWNDLSLPFASQTTIQVKVINPLINIANVSKEIEVLVWKYGGEDFFLNSICQVNNVVFPIKSGNADFPNSYEIETDKVDTINSYADYLWTTSLETVLKGLKYVRTSDRGFQDQYGVDWDAGKENFIWENTWKNKVEYPKRYPNHISTTNMDFDSGIKDEYRLKTGDETDFKNILRMPIRIVGNVKISNDKNYFVPVCPITTSLIGHSNLAEHSNLAFTHHHQIMKMFRLWRGSLRYTIIARGDNPIWVTYVPASGAIKFGLQPKYNNYRIYAGRANIAKFPLFCGEGILNDMSSSGNYTTMILPQVNPSEMIEVPWNLPENWAFTNQGTTQELRAFREIGDLVNGHLVIYSDDECFVDIVLSVGDDFDIAAFCGITDCIPMLQRMTRLDDGRLQNQPSQDKKKNFMIKDKKWKTQMDFQLNELTSNGSFMTQGDFEDLWSSEDYGKFVKMPEGALDVGGILAMGSFLLPAPLSDICRFFSVRKVAQRCDKLIGSIEGSTKALNEICQNTQSVIEPVKQVITSVDENIVKPLGGVIQPIQKVMQGVEGCVTQGNDMLTSLYEYVKNLFPAQFDILNLGDRVYTVITEMVYSLINGNPLNYMTTFLNIIKDMGLMNSDWINRNAYKVGDLFKKIFSSQTQMDIDILREQGEDVMLEDDKKTLLGLLFGGVLTSVGVYTNGWWQKGYKWFILDYIDVFTTGRGIPLLNGCITLVGKSFNAIRNMVNYIMGCENDEVRIRCMLAGKNGIIDSFINNAQEFLNNMNDGSMSNIKNKSKYWLTVCNAYQLQGCILRLGPNSVGSVLINLCRDVIKKANENCSLFQATAVRYEPFVICLEGAPGIGKSFLTSELAVMILMNLGIKTETIDIKYTVNPGVNYWNLYNGQPIIVYDDWANFTDESSSVKEFSELFQLKTSNVMNAPKAELSEKKTVVNPFGVVLCTNNPFPECNALYSKQALYRRRDVVVKCRLKEGINEYTNYNHLEFCFYTDVVNATLHTEWVNFDDFKETLRVLHLQYHSKESFNVKERIRILNKCLKEEALISDNLQDPFTLQARSLSNMENLAVSSQCPSEYLEAQVAELISIVNKNFKKINVTKSNMVVEGKCYNKHLYEVSTTQGEDGIVQEYFVVPIMKSLDYIKKKFGEWLYLGLRCNTCTSVCSDGWILKRCKGCAKNFCTRCAPIDENAKVICDVCNFELELVSLDWLEMLIGYILSIGWYCLAPSTTVMMMTGLVKFFSGFDCVLPTFLIKYVMKLINLKYTVVKEIEEETSIVISEVQMPPIEVQTIVNSPGKKKYRNVKTIKEDFVKPQVNPSLFRDYLEQGNGIALEIGKEEERIFNFNLEKCDNALCLHAELLTKPDVVYYNYNWQVDGKMYSAKSCQNKVDCPLLLQDGVHEEFIKKNYELYGMIYDKFVLDLQNKKISEVEFECKVPQYFWPKWYVGGNIRKEKEHLTGENWVDKLSEYVPKWIVKMLGTLASLGCIYFIFKASKKFLGYVRDLLYFVFGWESETQVAFEYDEFGNRLKAKKSKVRKGLYQTNISEPKENKQYYDNIIDKVIKNYIKLVINDRINVIGLGVYGSKILVPKHYLLPIKMADTIELRFICSTHENLKVNVNNVKIKEFKDRDLALIELSKAIFFKDIRKFFMDKEDLMEMADDELTIFVPRKNSEIEEIDVKVSGFLEEHEAFDKLSNRFFLSRDVVEYNFQEKGACGSLIARMDSHRPLLGIHIAGTEIENSGIGVLIAKEDLDDFEDSYDLAPLPYVLSEDVLDFGENVNVEYLGKLPVSLTPHIPVKSDIIHSVIDEFFETKNELEPAILSSKDERYNFNISPLIYGVRKHGMPTFDFDDSFVNEAYKFWEVLFMRNDFDFPFKPKVYTLEEAILGRPEVIDYYDPLPANTSAGWPWNIMVKEKDGSLITMSKKKHWINYQRNEQLQPIGVECDPKLVQVYEQEMKMRKEGFIVPIVFQDVLKDEKRKPEKLLKEGGTRVFSMSPVNASIAMRSYTLDFTSWVRKHRISNWIAVGICCDGPEWGRMVRRLLSKGNNIFSIDFSNFGPGLNVAVAGCFSRLVNCFNKKFMDYSKEDERVMDILILELLNSLHLAGGTIYRTKAGSPSGAAITVEMNSFVHLMYITIVWLIIGKIVRELCKKESQDVKLLERYNLFVHYFQQNGLNARDFLHKMSLDFFLENVIGCVYGDDGIFSVSDEFKEIFNAESIQLILRAHGIAATDATKKEKIVRYGKIEEMSFLKRGFSVHPKSSSNWLAPIEDISIRECCRWIHKTPNKKEMTRINVQASLVLAYGKGAEWFEKWKNEVNEHLIKANLLPFFIKWEELDEIFYPDLYFGTEVLDGTDWLKLRNDLIMLI